MFVAAVLVGACGSSAVSPSVSRNPSTPPASPTVAAATPSEAPSAGPTGASPAPTTSAPVPSGSASPASSPLASACSGSDDIRDFYAAIAEAVDWDVYCATLPDGWFVEKGMYRLAGGGWMEITYRGPGEAHFGLREGAFCGEHGDCVPDGTDAGPAAFGDRDGVLVAVDDGSWALAVDRGATLAWLATGSSLDEAAFRGLAEALVRVPR